MARQGPPLGLDEFLARGETGAAETEADNAARMPDASAQDWARFRKALADSSAAVAARNRTSLSEALRSLAESAHRLACGRATKRAGSRPRVRVLRSLVPAEHWRNTRRHFMAYDAAVTSPDRP